ncbi:MAG: hypothetical protein Q7S01_04840 [bacterium]|nr:hypothetical protein [bacterium]
METSIRPKYDLDKIKFSTGSPTWERAVELFEKGKVTKFQDNEGSYSATVIGTKPYEVWVSAEKFDVGDCNCYLGQKDELCKHLVALAIRVVTGGNSLSEKQKKMVAVPICSGREGELDKEKLQSVQTAISVAMKCIKAYNGPSRTWFIYQASLAEGCTRLAATFSELPVSEQTAQIVLKTLLRLDEKLCRGGVDDSDGAVGGFIEDAVSMLLEYVKLEPSCIGAFEILKGQSTCFEWEEPLLKISKREG